MEKLEGLDARPHHAPLYADLFAEVASEAGAETDRLKLVMRLPVLGPEASAVQRRVMPEREPLAHT
jgi:hypothetical protein